jgi:predicted NBD/HSP70 family sugar kinase
VQKSVTVPLRKVLDLVARGDATSRAEIARSTGLARSTVSQQVDYLIERGIVDEIETTESIRGRPPRILTISPRAGIIAVADVDVHTTRIAIADLSQRVIDRDVVELSVDVGPEKVLDAISARLCHLIGQAEGSATVRQVVVGLPAPVDFNRGCAVRPPIMPGWDGYPVGARMQAEFGAPVVVDNDVNLMALGEARQDTVAAPLLFVKIATGIGAGLVTAEGTVHRGADGAAGDIGHIRSLRGQEVLCRCGKVGCLEAVASFGAVLRALDIPESSSRDQLRGTRVLAERLAAGDATALHCIRQAATEIGEIVAMLVHVYNPRTLVLGGALSDQRDEILSGVRAVVYERALPLATRKLTITTTQLGDDAGTTGGVDLAVRTIFSDEGLTRLLAE